MRLFTPVFGIDLESPDIVKVAVEAVRKGYAIVPVAPGTKKASICTLTARELKAAGPDHKCGVYHAITDDKVARRVFARLVKEYGAARLNLGIVAYPSRMVCVDADTAVAVREFVEDWAAEEGDPGCLAQTPTVLTPGVMKADGEWAHKDGGHFLFELPEGIELGLGLQTLKPEGRSYDIRWGWSMSVVPPSVRPEGRYLPGGNVLQLPAWVLRKITAALDGYAERVAIRGTMFANDSIAEWSQRTDWADLLAPAGWEPTGKLDGCGCPVWTRPGDDVSTWKSATAHDVVCSRYENLENHGPLHIWTDHPPAPLDSWMETNGRTITKLNYVAVSQFSGDVKAAKVFAGIDPDPTIVDEWLGSDPVTHTVNGDTGIRPDEVADDPEPTEHPFWLPDELAPLNPSAPKDKQVTPASKIIAKAMDEAIRERAREYLSWKRGGSAGSLDIFEANDAPIEFAPEATVGFRTDGVGVLYRRRVNVEFGPSETGKSFFTLAMALSIVERGGRVLLIDTEDDHDGLRRRLQTLNRTQQNITYVRLWGLPTSRDRDVLVARAAESDLVIVDSFDGFLALLERMDSSVEIRAVNTLLKQWAMAGNAAVLIVDHASDKPQKDGLIPTTAMGSSSKKAAVDGIYLRATRLTPWRPDQICETMYEIGKDRHAMVRKHAIVDKESVDPRQFERLGLLRLEPAFGDADATLRFLPPPPFEGKYTARSNRPVTPEDRAAFERLIVEFLLDDDRRGAWQFHTDVLRAAGDKSGRGGRGVVLDDLVAEGVVECESTVHPITHRPVKRYRMGGDDPE